MLTLEIYYTADIVTPDGSDTGVYGCEPGDGVTLTSGWVDFDWSPWQVEKDAEDTRPDVAEAETVTELASLAAEMIRNRIGNPESVEPGRGTYYATQSLTDYHSGAEARYAAHLWLPNHVYGAPNDTPAELIAAVDLELAR